jgi:hypothetical protein
VQPRRQKEQDQSVQDDPLVFEITDGILVRGADAADPEIAAAADDSRSDIKRFRAKHALGLDPWVDTDARQENASNKNQSR